MRKNYIDNIRITCILLLFPFHTCRVFTEENFYVHANHVQWCDLFVKWMDPWFMPILFLLAGMSSYLSLNKRTMKEYIKERVSKILIPCICGVVLTVPIQTYYAEKFHNHFTGSYLEQLKLFFTKATDLTGYTGGFTPAHLWFLLVLFIVSLIGLPIILKIRQMRSEQFRWLENPIVLGLLCLLLIISSLIKIADREILGYLVLMTIGAILCANEKLLEIIQKYRRWYLGMVLITSVIFYFDTNGQIGEMPIILQSLNSYGRGWTTILAILGYGMSYYNGRNELQGYFRTASFPIYEVHQTILIVVAYYIVDMVSNFEGQYIEILVLSLVLSLVSYELLRSFKVTRWMFGIKERASKEKRIQEAVS